MTSRRAAGGRAEVSASVTAAFNTGRFDHVVAVSSVSQIAPLSAASREGRARRTGPVPRPWRALRPGTSHPGRRATPGLGMAALSVGGGAFEHRDPEAAAGDGLLADVVRGGQVDARLDLVGHPQHGRPGAGRTDGARSGCAGGEVGEDQAFVAHASGTGYPNPDPGDDAEGALTCRTFLAQIGPAADAGARPRSRMPGVITTACRGPCR